jgi:hypothetical protein
MIYYTYLYIHHRSVQAYMSPNLTNDIEDSMLHGSTLQNNYAKPCKPIGAEVGTAAAAIS